MLRTIAIFMLVTAAIGAIWACGGSSSSSGAGGASTQSYCATLSGYATQCNKNDACSQAEVAQCSTYASQFSSAYLAAATTCIKPPYNCSADGGTVPGSTQCIAQQLSAAAPTAAQQKVKDDFCAQCPDGTDSTNPTSCSQFFSVMFDDAGKTASTGYAVLVAGDALAQQIDQKCTGGTLSQDAGATLGCAGNFDLCAAFTLAFGSNSPQACNHN